MKPKIIEEKPIPMAELKKELDSIKKEDEELNFRANKTDEYLSQMTKLSSKKAEELKGKLEGLNISRLKDEFIVKIIDTLPGTVDELRVLLQGYIVSINQADMKKIVELVKEYKPKK
ncbi:hypothetical protein GF336_04415 [Candidatus Woesearchaeota archaeon]|nr:hypothetical protein [Candidatus Woesearchaeota archaeon]